MVFLYDRAWSNCPILEKFGQASSPQRCSHVLLDFLEAAVIIKGYAKKTCYPLVICYIANWKITIFFMGKSTISMAIFNSHVKLPEGITYELNKSILQASCRRMWQTQSWTLMLWFWIVHKQKKKSSGLVLGLPTHLHPLTIKLQITKCQIP